MADNLLSGKGPDTEQLLSDLTPPSNFGAGFRAGAGGLTLSLGGLMRMIGDAARVDMLSSAGDAVADKGKEIVEENPAPIQEVADIDSVERATSVVSYALGQMLPSLGAAVVGGALGRRLAGDTGALGGVAAASVGQETGSIYKEAVDAGIDSPGTRAIVGGAAAGALDAVPDIGLLSAAKLLRGSPLFERLISRSTGGDLVSKMTNATGAAAKFAALEGVTEYAQTFIEQAAVDRQDAAGAESERQVAAVLGAAGGGVAGAAATAVGDFRAPNHAETTPPPQVQPTLPTGTGAAETPAETPSGPAPAVPLAADSALPNLDFTGLDIFPTTAPNLPDIYSFEDIKVPPAVVPPEIETPSVVSTDQNVKVRLPNPVVIGEAAGNAELVAALYTPPALRTIDQVAAINLAPNPFSDLPVIDVPDANLIEVKSNNLRLHLSYNEAYIAARTRAANEEMLAAAQGAENATRQIGIEGISGQERQGRDGGGQAAEAGRRDSAVSPATSEVILTEGVRSGQNQAAVDELTRLRLRLGMPITPADSFRLRTMSQPAPVPDLAVVTQVGGTPRTSLKEVPVAERGEFMISAIEDAVAVESQPLVEAKAFRSGSGAKELYALRSAMAKAIQDVLKREIPASEFDAKFREAALKPLKGKLLKQDAETLVDAVYARLQSIPREFLSKGATQDVRKLAAAVSEWHNSNGGSTFDPRTGVNLAGTANFSVSTFKGREVKIEGNPTPAQIEQYIIQNFDALSQPGASLGTWLNPDDGYTYLDVSTVVPSKDEALRLAMANDQLAIFDLGSATVIPTPATSEAQSQPSRAAIESRLDNAMTQRGEQVRRFLEDMLGAPKNLEVRGYYSDVSGAGAYRAGRYKDVIEFAYNSKDVLSVAAHEGFHYLENRVLNDKERAVIAQAFAPGGELRQRLLTQARIYDLTNGTQLEEEIRMVPAEARAYGYEFWRQGKLDVKGPLQTVFEKIRDFVQRIRNYIDGLGFQTYRDIFRAIENGEYAVQERDGLRVNSAVPNDWYADVEPDVVPGALGVFRRDGDEKNLAGPAKQKGASSTAKGRPWWVQSASDVASMRGTLRNLALDGEAAGARDWHIRSGNAMMRWAKGDKKRAELLAKLVANFSPRTPVGLDLKKALAALAQFEANVPVDPGATKEQIKGAYSILSGGNVTGIKRQNFFQNLMQTIDPDNYGVHVQGATIDMWMAHAFGYGNDAAGTVSKSEYNYANAETQRLARELGWRVDETQAAIWVAIKARANSVRSFMQKYAAARGWYDLVPPTKGDLADGNSQIFSNEKGVAMKRVLKKEFEREYVMTWMNFAMQARPKRDQYAAANYSYAEAMQDVASGEIDLKLTGAAAEVASDWDLGFKGDDVSAPGTPDSPNLVLFSKAATVDLIQRARNGQDETEQLRRNIANTIDRAGFEDGFRDRIFGLPKSVGAGTLESMRHFYETHIASGQYLSRASAGYKNVFGVLSAYTQRRNRLISQALEKDLSIWTSRATTEDREAVSRVLLERTMNNWKDGAAGLNTALGTLTPIQRQMYDQARKMIDSRLLAEFRADQAAYERVLGPESEQFKEWLELRQTQVSQLIENGYFPERRYGDHGVHVSFADATGQRITLFYELHESRVAADQRRQQIALALRDYPELSVEYGYKYKAPADGSLSFGQFIEMARRQGIDLTQTEKERLAKALISADSTKNNRIFRRENIPGMSKDGMRILAEFGVASSNKIAYSELGEALQDALKGDAIAVRFDAMGQTVVTKDDQAKLWRKDGEMGGYYHQLADRTVEFATGPSTQNAVSRTLRTAAGLNFLGGSLAAGAVNATSLGMNTIPYLTKDTSYTDAAGKVLSAVKTAVANRSTMLDFDKLLDPNIRMPGIDEVPGLRQAITTAAQDGTVLDTELYQLMGLTRGQQYTWSKAAQVAGEKWMLPFRYSEQINRISTFIAAYNVGLSKKKSGKELYDFAQEAVFATQFRYDEANRPAMARGPLGSVLFTFKTYPLYTFELMQGLAKENPGAAAIMLLSIAMMAGIDGLPLAEDLMDLIDTVAQRVFKSPFNTDRAMKNALKSASEAMVGVDLSGVFMHGLANSLTGLNFASRVGMGNFIPASRLGTADADWKQNAMEILGPAGGYVPNLFEGLDMASRGAWEAGMRKILPTAAGNLTRGWLQWQRGYATDAGGRRLVDVGTPLAFAQSLGFSSAGLNQAYQLDRIDKQTSAFYNQVKRDFLNEIARKATDGDAAGVQEAIDSIVGWNKTQPDYPIAISVPDLRRKIAEAKMPMELRNLLNLPKMIRKQSESAIGLDP